MNYGGKGLYRGFTQIIQNGEAPVYGRTKGEPA